MSFVVPQRKYVNRCLNIYLNQPLVSLLIFVKHEMLEPQSISAMLPWVRADDGGKGREHSHVSGRGPTEEVGRGVLTETSVEGV